ncbi:MAG TPA: PEP/pyruvate-binding domain-containing protein, partial [Anaerolineaceae bacterium]
RGLQDYDERMGALIQVVEGEPFGRYYLPQVSGVAFSRNLYRWAPQIRREDGFVRMVWGLGTRAVERVGNDYPRLVALSHPLLRPSSDPKSVRRYSQQYVDLIDLEHNDLRTLPIREVLTSRYPPLRYLAQMDEEDFFVSLRSSVLNSENPRLVLTFEELLRRTDFAEKMRTILRLLEQSYNTPVDLEFTVRLNNLNAPKPQVEITVLQCRPQSHLLTTTGAQFPSNLPVQDVIFATCFVVPDGQIRGVRYVVYVPAQGYFSLPTMESRFRLKRAIGRLNAALVSETFICVGPGRWGSSNSDLGVPVDYGDIYNSRALVEVSGMGIGPAPEPSLGTHFFQDILESQIYPLAIHVGEEQSSFNTAFFDQTPNRVKERIPIEDDLVPALRLVDVEDFRPGYRIHLVMSDERSQALAYLVKK